MRTIKKIQEELIQDFEMFENWMQKYEYLIDLGKELTPINQQHKTEENLIKGCQSKVWLNAEYTNGKIIFSADSEAIMTKGIVALLINVLSNQTPKDIANAKLDFIDKLGLKEQLSVTRANGLASMIKKMKLYAIAFNN
tara:strand:+ start:1085 stop:1501 length:417 start_codon:yes stop_codon:yes gene_type:complete